METKRIRDPAADLIRCAALFCVVAVHFFLNNGFYQELVQGPRMFLMVCMRNAFMVCVPLFMMLTGYLNQNAEVSRGYFRKLLRPLGIYVLASICCAAYQLLIQREAFSVLHAAAGLFSFRTAPYAWYMEMYIGLFLLTPFLNSLYTALDSKRKKQCLLAVLLILTALPSALNIFRAAGPAWWLQPSSDGAYHQLIPQWWRGFYPITYFFLGSYLREFPLKQRPALLGAALFLLVLLAGAFNFYRSHGSVFVSGQWSEYGSLLITGQTVLAFSFICALPCDRLHPTAQKALTKLSGWTLGAYLVSWIFDRLAYDLLNRAVPVMQDRLPWFFLVVPAVFLCALTLSALLSGLYRLFEKGGNGLLRQLKKQ